MDPARNWTRHCSAKSPWQQLILKEEQFWQFPMLSDMWTALPEDSHHRHMLAHVRSSNKFTKFHMSCLLWQSYPSSMQLSERVGGGCRHTWAPHLEAVESQVECRETQGMAEQAPSTYTQPWLQLLACQWTQLHCRESCNKHSADKENSETRAIKQNELIERSWQATELVFDS